MPDAMTWSLVVHLVVTTPPPAGVSPSTMAAELDRIWRPAISLTLDTATAPADGGRTIWLRFADDLGPAAHAHALGWTPFSDGRPGAVITISPARVRAVLTASDPSCRRPDAAACVVPVSRALARVAAHEVGHVVLGTPGHDRRGLMREGLGRDELFRPDPRGLALPAGIRARLRERTTLDASRRQPGREAAPQ